NVAFTAYYRGYKVGRRYPAHYRTHLIYTGLTGAIVLALISYNPLSALLLFVTPMMLGLLITAWATYDHHAGLPTENDFCASYNNMNPLFNLVTGNLGFHTAHHYRLGVHWSELPQLHEEIKHNIPPEVYRSSFWDAVTRLPVVKSLLRPVF
ncbi:MAG: fatty acid desaturase, partial [Pseudomonadales bacterium]|nr:fatty acid desaturase [Pseudomonadales bacterium]